nr:hypothetical protein [Vibrio splendidus]
MLLDVALYWLVYVQKLDIYVVIGIALILSGVDVIKLFSTLVSY